MKNCANKLCKNLIDKRGVIFCDDCISSKKSNSRIKKEYDMEEILTQITAYQKDNEVLRGVIEKNKTEKELLTSENVRLSNEYERLKKEYERLKNIKTAQTDNIQNTRFDSIHGLLQKTLEDKEKLLKEKANYEMTFQQTKLDLENHKIELERLFRENSFLLKENQSLKTEKELIKTQ